MDDIKLYMRGKQNIADLIHSTRTYSHINVIKTAHFCPNGNKKKEHSYFMFYSSCCTLWSNPFTILATYIYSKPIAKHFTFWLNSPLNLLMVSSPVAVFPGPGELLSLFFSILTIPSLSGTPSVNPVVFSLHGSNLWPKLSYVRRCCPVNHLSDVISQKRIFWSTCDFESARSLHTRVSPSFWAPFNG